MPTRWTRKSWRGSTGKSEYEVAIIGPGALGRVFAARLGRVAEVALVARSEERAAALRAGYRLREAGGEVHVFPNAYGPESAPRARWAVVLVKTPDTVEAGRTAARLATAGAVSLQNGWVDDLLPPTVRQGASTVAAKFEEDGAVRLVSEGNTWLPPGFEELARTLSAAGLPAEASSELAAVRLRKLAVNLVINPLTAVLNRPTGALLEPPAWELVGELVREMAPVLQARGLAVGEEELLELVGGVIRATAANTSSMLADVRAGRRTEIEEITGVLLRWGSELGLELPRHRALYHLVRALEKVDRGQPLQQ